MSRWQRGCSRRLTRRSKRLEPSALYQASRKPLRDQCSCWIPVAPGAPSDLSKGAEVQLAKKTSFQSLTNSVLNPRSPEVWRKTAGENDFWVSAGVSQCRGLRAKASVYWGLFRPDEPAENIWRGATGGPRGIRTHDTVSSTSFSGRYAWPHAEPESKLESSALMSHCSPAVRPASVTASARHPRLTRRRQRKQLAR